MVLHIIMKDNYGIIYIMVYIIIHFIMMDGGISDHTLTFIHGDMISISDHIMEITGSGHIIMIGTALTDMVDTVT